MRKFRVYDKLEKRYVTDEKNWTIRPDGKLYEIIASSLGLQSIKTDPNRYIVEYGTGLVDSSNETEIYESDVLLYNYFDDEDKCWHSSIYIVFWDNKKARFRIRQKDCSSETLEDTALFTVTGNIHEEE